jgi:hypothetical protein
MAGGEVPPGLIKSVCASVNLAELGVAVRNYGSHAKLGG